MKMGVWRHHPLNMSNTKHLISPQPAFPPFTCPGYGGSDSRKRCLSLLKSESLESGLCC